jgi:hypothetical protein
LIYHQAQDLDKDSDQDKDSDKDKDEDQDSAQVVPIIVDTYPQNPDNLILLQFIFCNKFILFPAFTEAVFVPFPPMTSQCPRERCSCPDS